MLGVHERRNRNTLSTGSMAVATMANNMAVIGEVPLVNFYNDGSRSATHGGGGVQHVIGT
jgi:hypothetical protein